MQIQCAECGGENLRRDPDAAQSREIALVCLDCGWRGRRTPRTACRRCGSPEVDETPVDGWAYGDLEAARDNPEDPDWGYVDKSVFRCRKCHNEWTIAGEYRPYGTPGGT